MAVSKEALLEQSNVTNPHLIEGIFTGMIRMQEIGRNRLPYFQETARQTNFQVNVVAQGEEEMITAVLGPKIIGISRTGVPQVREVVVSLVPVLIGSKNLGISLERPSDKSYSFTDFYSKLKRVEIRYREYLAEKADRNRTI